MILKRKRLRSFFESPPKWVNLASFFLILFLPPVLSRGCARYFLLDIKMMSRWSVSWSERPATVYLSCPDCPYPIVGTALSAGAISAIRGAFPEITWKQVHRRFRGYLSIFDIANSLLLAFLLFSLNVPGACFFSLLIYCLPSTWAGGALWGQIDVVTQFFILISAAGFLTCLKSLPGASERSRGEKPFRQSSFKAGAPPDSKRNPEGEAADTFLDCRTAAEIGRAYAAYTAGVLGMILGMLTKQLFFFSLPGLLLFWLAASASLLINRGREGRRGVALINLLGILCLVAPEIVIRIPPGYSHHLIYILLGGRSSHGGIIARNGFNIWVLLGYPMDFPSTVPFGAGISPRAAGIVLYLLYLTFLMGRMIRPLISHLRDASDGSGERLNRTAALIIVLIGLSNLGFNVLLTGTHERYLYHAYPFLLAGFLYLRGRVHGVGWGSIVCLIIAAGVYGSFVYSRLDESLSPLRNEFITAAVHLGLLLWLSGKWLLLTRPPDRLSTGAASADRPRAGLR